MSEQSQLSPLLRSDFWYDGNRQFFIMMTVGTDSSNSGLLRFVDSCITHSIPFRILGQGQPWQGGDMTNNPGGGQKVNLLKAGLIEIRDIFPEVFANLVVLFTDCYDVCVSALVDEILKKYAAFQKKIVFSTEVSCWPDSELSKQYPLSPCDSPFQYLNSGGFIGYATDILDLINGASIRNDEDDQRYYTNHFLNPRSTDTHRGLTLDYRCEIFQTLNHVPKEYLDLSSLRAKNKLFHTRPCLFHANGDHSVAQFFDHPIFKQQAPQAFFPPQLNNKINHIIVINMEHRIEKRIFMEQQLKICLQDHPDISVEFFAAVDGTTIAASSLHDIGGDIDKTWANPYNNKPLTHGEVGCALSHHAVWKKIRNGNWSNVLVIEDDVLIPADLIAKLEALIEESSRPWDLAYVGRKPLRCNEYHLSQHIVVPKYSYWTNAYILNSSGANKLLSTDYLQQIIPVDEYLPLMYHSHFNAKLLKHYSRFAPLLAIAFDPPLVRPIDFNFQESDTEISPSFNYQEISTNTYHGLITQIQPKVIIKLRHEFLKNGYVKLPQFLSLEGLRVFKKECSRLHQFVTNRDFIMEEYDTPRKLGVIGGQTISTHSQFFNDLYVSQIIRSTIESITGTKIYDCNHIDEFMVINFLRSEGETHGWHLDDPEYALVIFIEAPTIGKGGEVELTPNWEEICAKLGVSPSLNITSTIKLCQKSGLIQSKYHCAGDAYLLRADKYMHRVTELGIGQQRVVLNLAYQLTKNRHYAATAYKLYGKG
jgi:GR25 family glycosyltransferase involved in LPS biosynthesis